MKKTTPDLLIIDDDVALARSVERILKGKFDTTIKAHNIRDARKVLNEQISPQSLVFSDFHLPDGIGLQLAKETFEIRKQLQIAFMLMSGGACGSADETSMIENAVSEGIIQAYFEKPLDIAAVRAEVQTYLDSLLIK